MEQFRLHSEESKEGGLDKQPETPAEFSVEELTDVEASEVLGRTVIHGSLINGRPLTVDELEAEGLVPKLRVCFENGVEWNASPVYELERGYAAVIAFVKAGDITVARSFYLSQSQLAWRYLPQYLSIGGQIQWFGKWVSEYAITAPLAVQQVLAPFKKEKPLKVKNPMRFFMGTSNPIEKEPRTLLDNVIAMPVALGPKAVGFYRSHANDERRSPEMVGSMLLPEQHPSFEQGPLARWTASNDLYGDVVCEVFPSFDKSLRFQFCYDKLGRAWIVNIENDSPVQSVGVRKSWIDGGDLMTPAYEYAVQAGGKFFNPKLAKGKYIDMFGNYLVHIPIIRDYLCSVEKRDADDAIKEKIARNLVHTAKSFEELYLVIRALPPQEKKTDWETMIAMIGSMRIGEVKSATVTSRFGIRKRVNELMAESINRRSPGGLSITNG